MKLDASLRERLRLHGQEQVLCFWDSLDDQAQQLFSQQLADVDFEMLSTLIAGADESVDFGAMAMRADLPPAVSSDGSGANWSVADARAAGEKVLAAGQIATVLVAGGQGTRLGFDQPKGMFPIGPVSHRTLFQFFADRLIATGRRYGVTVPLYLMTSDATDAETREYFAANGNLGLTKDQLVIFRQGTMPAVDAATGKILLSQKGSLAVSPDGHGGTLRALEKSGCLDHMSQAGITHLFYFQVDNPLVELCDPVFIGHHVLAKSEMTTQVIRKRYPAEKVGNVVQVDGRTRIIEYSDLPDEAAAMTDSEGNLKLWAGNIAVHLFTIDFLQRMKASATALPFHRANKKVPFLDQSGKLIEPATPNAIKYERFIFDLLPAAEQTIVCEVDPAMAFAPVKNADGAATDTPELARRAISDLHRRWLEQAGVCVDPDAEVEINPKFALDAQSLVGRFTDKSVIKADRYFDA